jgi:hypothetical protein
MIVLVTTYLINQFILKSKEKIILALKELMDSSEMPSNSIIGFIYGQFNLYRLDKHKLPSLRLDIRLDKLI